MDMPAMRRRVAEARVGHLATVGSAVAGEGRPHIVPMCFVLIGDVVYSAVDHKPKRSPRLRRIANIEATGHACMLVDVYQEDWSRLWWVRVDGVGRVVTDAAEAAVAVRALAEKYEQYARRPPTGPVLALDVRRWSGWAAGPGALDSAAPC